MTEAPLSGDGAAGAVGTRTDGAAAAGAPADTPISAGGPGHERTGPQVLRGEPDEVEVAAVVAALVALSAAAGTGRGGGSGGTDRSGAPHRRGGDPWAARGRPAALSRGVGGPWRNGPGARPRTGT